VGGNLRHLQSKLAHVNRLLADSPEEALEGAEVVIVASSHPAVLGALARSNAQVVLDTNGRLGDLVEHLPGYEGVSW
jgi:GDP-mannose 6-dehydrogenase